MQYTAILAMSCITARSRRHTLFESVPRMHPTVCQQQTLPFSLQLASKVTIRIKAHLPNITSVVRSRASIPTHTTGTAPGSQCNRVLLPGHHCATGKAETEGTVREEWPCSRPAVHRHAGHKGQHLLSSYLCRRPLCYICSAHNKEFHMFWKHSSF